MQQSIQIPTPAQNGLYDITPHVEAIVAESCVKTGLVNVYVQGATAGIWEHDAQDKNGDSHLKAGIVGPQETIPIVNGKMGLSTWQNIFLCEFDGPRSQRNILVTIMGGEPS